MVVKEHSHYSNFPGEVVHRGDFPSSSSGIVEAPCIFDRGENNFVLSETLDIQMNNSYRIILEFHL